MKSRVPARELPSPHLPGVGTSDHACHAMLPVSGRSGSLLAPTPFLHDLTPGRVFCWKSWVDYTFVALLRVKGTFIQYLKLVWTETHSEKYSLHA